MWLGIYTLLTATLHSSLSPSNHNFVHCFSQPNHFEYLIDVESCSIGHTVTGLFILEEYCKGSSMVSQIAELYSFLRLPHVPLYVCATFSLSTHPLMDS